MAEFICLTYGSISYSTDDIYGSFHDMGFFFIFCKKIARNEEKSCHQKLPMCHPLSSYGSVGEAGEFGL